MNLYFVLTLVLLYATSSSACGKRSAKSASSRIVGGTQSVPNKWPWMTAIYRQNKFICGGAVVSNRYVVSAAHCFVGGGLPPSSYHLMLGAHDLTKSGTKYLVDGITVPASYKQNGHYNDLALIKTKSAITFNSKIAAICMPSGDMGKLEGKEAYVAGWGATSEGGLTTNVLREVKTPIVDKGKCSQSYQRLRLEGLRNGITDTQICAGYFSGGKDSCQGDSGGPLMMNTNGGWTLVGVVSFGQGCAEKNFPGVYTRIDKFRSWIGTNSRSAVKSKKKPKG